MRSQRWMLRSTRRQRPLEIEPLPATLSLTAKSVLRMALSGLRSSCATVAVSWPERREPLLAHELALRLAQLGGALLDAAARARLDRDLGGDVAPGAAIAAEIAVARRRRPAADADMMRRRRPAACAGSGGSGTDGAGDSASCARICSSVSRNAARLHRSRRVLPMTSSPPLVGRAARDVARSADCSSCSQNQSEAVRRNRGSAPRCRLSESCARLALGDLAVMEQGERRSPTPPSTSSSAAPSPAACNQAGPHERARRHVDRRTRP